MYLSRYLKVFPCPWKPGYLILYSIKNSAIALVAKEDYLRFQQGEISEEFVAPLAELSLLVPNLEAELKEIRNMPDEINRLNPALNAAVVLGMSCNFSCIYCYEGSQKGNLAMSDTTAEQLVTFLKELYTSRNKQRLILDFYGGEPLLYIQKIKNIAGALKKFVEDCGGEFRFSVVTNGSLLTREVAENLIPVGLYGAKVTVDGPADEHNRQRPFKTGEPSFEIILNNINNCFDLIKIGFGGNYTQDNYKKITKLLDTLETLKLTPEKLGLVQFFPVMQTTDQFSNPEFTGGCVSTNEPWLIESSLMVREATLCRGYRTPKLTISSCMVDLDDALVINHDGGIYKCVALIGHEQYLIGNILKGISNYEQKYHLKHWQHNGECKKCEYLPLCFGGCRYMEFQRSGNMEKVDCMLDFWEGTLEKTVLQDLRFQENTR